MVFVEENAGAFEELRRAGRRTAPSARLRFKMSTGGEVANALVCKTSIHGFKSHSVLHNFNNLRDFS